MRCCHRAFSGDGRGTSQCNSPEITDISPWVVVMSLPVAPLALSGEDRAEVDGLACSGDRRLQERAGDRAGLRGLGRREFWGGCRAGLSVETVRKWRSRFAQSG